MTYEQARAELILLYKINNPTEVQIQRYIEFHNRKVAMSILFHDLDEVAR